MAFDLPRSPRSLRFTGEVRSLAAKPVEKERPMRPRLPSNGVDTPTRMRTVRGDGVRRSLPSISGDDDDGDRETLCMDRDALDVALLPKQNHSFVGAAPQLPVPGFRSLEDVLRQQHAALNAPIAARPGGPFPLAVWLIASLLLAIVSFFAAPVARDTMHAALLRAPAAER